MLSTQRAPLSIVWALPAFGSVCGITTILTVYYLTATNGHLPVGVSTPPISFLGTRNPEHTAYQIGFPITGALLAACIGQWTVLVEPALRSAGYTRCASCGRIGGWLACLGVAGQGLITSDSDIVTNIQEKNPVISMQSIVHQVIACFFFFGAASHCYSMTYAILSSNTPEM